ncbi:RNase H domain protein, partial [Fusarium tricinctum]
ISYQTIPHVTRFIHRDIPKTLLIYISGACPDNGQECLQSGWACVFRPLAPNIHLNVSGRLEHRGPMDDIHWQSSDKAELRAVVGALRFRHWSGEGFTRLVLATNSEHVVKGGTEWAQNWCLRGWRTSFGCTPKNRDMWEAFFGELERLEEHGLKVQLRKIPRNLNKDTIKLAKEVTQEDELNDYVDATGTLC